MEKVSSYETASNKNTIMTSVLNSNASSNKQAILQTMKSDSIGEKNLTVIKTAIGISGLKPTAVPATTSVNISSIKPTDMPTTANGSIGSLKPTVMPTTIKGGISSLQPAVMPIMANGSISSLKPTVMPTTIKGGIGSLQPAVMPTKVNGSISSLQPTVMPITISNNTNRIKELQLLDKTNTVNMNSKNYTDTPEEIVDLVENAKELYPNGEEKTMYAQAYLSKMGFYIGYPGIDGDAPSYSNSWHAIKTFQEMVGIEATGKANETTLEKMKNSYNSGWTIYDNALTLNPNLVQDNGWIKPVYGGYVSDTMRYRSDWDSPHWHNGIDIAG